MYISLAVVRTGTHLYFATFYSKIRPRSLGDLSFTAHEVHYFILLSRRRRTIFLPRSPNPRKCALLSDARVIRLRLLKMFRGGNLGSLFHPPFLPVEILFDRCCCASTLSRIFGTQRSLLLGFSTACRRRMPCCSSSLDPHLIHPLFLLLFLLFFFFPKRLSNPANSLLWSLGCCVHLVLIQ
ncbi:hypothetical protein MPTK1_4g14410 [Marchantia polymorpha subsp. ruderalis]|uniref:Transmembrane protein n=2 Tax=Marchantia polymorpha TaxID=3197 RepID=A0AAF6B9U4_MARPO|nr:hypothetical protein MARPO_0070s0040 [Marchantia polymorpha]BBN08778.1 hypothetical protein Mp_4g14410 [Marchantia polymorpha subsp. ruderalis]|eukprot:PTQ35574.1 hypothetical protein MARPO_0070s0040 [Marchantia polymorpha]